MAIAYIGLGSNLDNPLEQIKQALVSINQMHLSQLEHASSFYRSRPWGKSDQPDFINAVAKIITGLKPLDLLSALQLIEKKQKRVRNVRWGARTLDLDVLLYDKITLNLLGLVIPHPRMLEREFVVYPLSEIAPDLQLPSGESLAAVKARLPMRGLTIYREQHENCDLSRHI